MDENSKVQAEYFWRVYQENATQGRHHETQRSTVASLILVIAGAAITVATYEKQIDAYDLPLAAMLIALSIFGFGFSAKHYERYRLHLERARNYRDALDAVLPSIQWDNYPNLKKRIDFAKLSDDDKMLSSILLLKVSADKRHKVNFPPDSGSLAGRLHHWWSILYGFIGIVGLVLGCLALQNSI